MKIKHCILGFTLAAFALASCQGNSNDTTTETKGTGSVPTEIKTTTPDTTTNEKPAGSTIPSVPTTTPKESTTTTNVVEDKVYNKPTTIYLAGDSTVKTYLDQQYIGGWGQYLDLFLDDDVTVKNCAQGGRSSRSFINEGRLFDTKENGYSYTFTENEGKSIESCIKADDFLFIQFGHNDDDTKDYTDTQYKYLRMVPVGTPDSKGIYPTIKPNNKKSTTSNLPSDMSSSVKSEIAKYGANYYEYDEAGSNGTFKGYLKEYIDFARAKGATPVLVTPVTRVKWSGNTIVGAAGAHGENLEYVEAVRQLANEEDCLLVDLYAYTKELLETATPSYANYLMALKPNSLTGAWPAGYDSTYNNTDAGYEGIEATHYNKYGAYLTAAKVAEVIKNSKEVHNDDEYFSFKDFVKDSPSSYVNPSNLISKAKIPAIEATIKDINVTDPNRTYPTNDALVAKLAEIPSVENITVENYVSVQTLLNEAKALYSVLNVDDRKAEFSTKLKATETKIQEIIISLRPKATETYAISFAGMSAVSDIKSPFIVDDPNSKFSISNKCLKFGGNGSTANTNLSITCEGKGKILITINAYSGSVEKACLLGVSDGTTEKKESITDGSATAFEFEYEIDGSSTFYMYRASGSSTGVMISSITVEYFAE